VVPPEGLAAKATDWPLSMVGDDGDIAPALKATLTVTWTADEVAATGVPALSVTVAQ
jgi:hypothetical protein